MVNRSVPHLHVLPEDQANVELANGFRLNVPWLKQRQMRVLPPARGWMRVLELFRDVHVTELSRNPNRLMVLLIDFDHDLGRLDYARSFIPPHLADRVFVVGSLRNPEHLRRELGWKFEDIGGALANDCRDGTSNTWEHPQLRINGPEIARLRAPISQILF